MSTKVLSIVIKAQDEASAILRGTTADIGRLGGQVTNMHARSEAASRAIGAMWRGIKAGAAVGLAAAAATGAATVGVLREIKQVADELDELGEKARALDLPVEDFSTMEYAAKRANVEVDALAKAFLAGEKAIAEYTRTGSGPAKDTLRGMHVAWRDMKGDVRSMYELLPEITSELSKLAGQEDRQQALADIFGKQGASIERLVASGSLAAYRRELENIGGVITEEQVRNAQRLSDAVDRVSFAWRGVKAEAMSTVAPTAEAVLNRAAKELGELPDKFKGAALAVRNVANGELGAQEAWQMGRNIGDAAQKALLVTVKEVAKVGAMTFVDFLKMELRMSIPFLSDVARDAVAPIWNATAGRMPGVGKLEFSTPYQILGRIGTMQAELNRIEAGSGRSGFSGRMNALASQYAGGMTEWQRAVQTARSNMLSDTMTSVSLGPDVAKRQIELRAMIEGERKNLGNLLAGRSQALDGELQTFLSGTAGRVVAAGRTIEAAWERVDAATERLSDYYRIHGPPPASKAQQPAATPTYFGPDVGAFFTAMYSQQNRLAEVLLRARNVGWEQRAIEARGLEAGSPSDARQGARSKLLLDQEKERVELVQKYGREAMGTLLPALERVWGIERGRLEYTQAMTVATQGLERTESTYQDGVTRRSALVQAGLMSQLQANESTLTAQKALRGELQNSLQLLQENKSTWPQYSEVAQQAIAEVEQKLAMLNAEMAAADKSSMRRGFLSTFDDLQVKARDLRQVGRDFGDGMVNVFANDLPAAIAQSGWSLREFRDIINQTGLSLFQTFQQVALQMLVVRSLAGIANAFAPSGPNAWGGGSGYNTFPGSTPGMGVPGVVGGGTVGRGGYPGISLAGLRGYAGGGLVTRGADVDRDTVLAALAYGEGVVSRRGMRAQAPGTLAYMNAGGRVEPSGSAPSIGPVSITVNVNGGGAFGATQARQVQAAVEGALDTILSNPTKREGINRRLGR